jgi:hypothetical protein
MIVFGLTTKISSTKVGDFFCANAALVCATAAVQVELGGQHKICMTIAPLFPNRDDR